MRSVAKLDHFLERNFDNGCLQHLEAQLHSEGSKVIDDVPVITYSQPC